jgi:dihydroorotate dehydrogenase (NAD+) catalytic subunit
MIDDVMEYLVAGASAVQVGTATFYDPTACIRITEALPAALKQIGCESVGEAIGAMHR